jgi:hypothetical protein
VLGRHCRVNFEHRGQNLALADLRVGQSPQDRHPRRRTHQIQLQPPVEPRMAGAVAITRPASQLRALHRRPGHAAGHRGGIDDPAVVQPEVARFGQHSDDPFDQAKRGAEPIVVPGLLREVGEQTRQVLAGIAQPVRLGGEAEQRLGNRDTHQLGVGQHRWPARPPRSCQLVIDLHVQCGQEGVQVLRHNMILTALSSRLPTSPGHRTYSSSSNVGAAAPRAPPPRTPHCAPSPLRAPRAARGCALHARTGHACAGPARTGRGCCTRTHSRRTRWTRLRWTRTRWVRLRGPARTGPARAERSYAAHVRTADPRAADARTGRGCTSDDWDAAPAYQCCPPPRPHEVNEPVWAHIASPSAP